MGIFSFSMVFIAMLLRVVNSRYLMKIKHQYKIWCAIVFSVLSIGFLILSKQIQLFGFTIVSCLLVGFSISLGDCTIIGFMKCFPAIIFSGYSSGTGMSGVVGATFYLVLKFFSVPFEYIVLSLLVFYPIYGLCFYLVMRLKVQLEESMKQNNNSFVELEEVNISIDKKERETKGMKLPSIRKLQENESQINQKLSWSSFKRVFKKGWLLYMDLLIMYFLEYISLTAISSQISIQYHQKYPANKAPKVIFVFFEILQLCYQLGVWLARSSLDIMRIKRIWIIVLFLSLATIGFFLQSIFHSMVSYWVPFMVLLVIGFVGGLGYVNVYHQILKHPEVEKKYKEISTNLTGIFADLGIISSSLVGFLLQIVCANVNKS